MKLQNVQKRYAEKTALSVAELTLSPGTIYAAIGANGSGKSTLARVMAGAVQPNGGAVDAEGARVGYMPQRSYAFFGTVRHNLMLGASRAAASKEAQQQRADWLLDALNLQALANSSAKKLSGGETARMALARVLMGEYQFVILDEPTAAFDIRATLDAERLVREYRDETGAGVLIVTHSIKQARRLADEVLFLHEGRIAEQGAVGQVLDNPQTDELRSFLEFLGS